MSEAPLSTELSEIMSSPEEAGKFDAKAKVWTEMAVRLSMLKAYNAAIDSLKKSEHSKVIPFTGEACVVVSSGTDDISLHTTLPSPYSPTVNPTPLTLKFTAPHGKGEEYVKRVFGIKPKVIKI